MSQYNTLKQAIQNVIRTNGNNEITGASLQQSLLSMINSLGAGYQFMGVATPSTNPGTIDYKAFYLANEQGSYVHFGLSVDTNELAAFLFDSTWHKFHIATIGGGGSADAVQYVPQVLTDRQKMQARKNQGLPYKEEISSTAIDWNGDTEGLISAFSGGESYPLFRISDASPSALDLQGSMIKVGGVVSSINDWQILTGSNGYCYTSQTEMPIAFAVAFMDGANFSYGGDDIFLPKKGLYFMGHPNGTFIERISATSNVFHPTVFHKLENSYLPPVYVRLYDDVEDSSLHCEKTHYELYEIFSSGQNIALIYRGEVLTLLHADLSVMEFGSIYAVVRITVDNEVSIQSSGVMRGDFVDVEFNSQTGKYDLTELNYIDLDDTLAVNDFVQIRIQESDGTVRCFYASTSVRSVSPDNVVFVFSSVDCEIINGVPTHKLVSLVFNNSSSADLVETTLS